MTTHWHTRTLTGTRVHTQLTHSHSRTPHLGCSRRLPCVWLWPHCAPTPDTVSGQGLAITCSAAQTVRPASAVSAETAVSPRESPENRPLTKVRAAARSRGDAQAPQGRPPGGRSPGGS